MNQPNTRFKISLVLSCLLLLFTSAAGFTISLDQGWNSVSGPEAFSVSELGSQCSLESVGGEKIWGFVNSSWVHHDDLRSSLGYYVFSQESCEVNVTPLEKPSKDAALDQGWNLISNQKSSSWRCGGGSDYWHPGESGKWEKVGEASETSESKGYWFRADDRCELKQRRKSFTIVSDEGTSDLQYSFKTDLRPEPKSSGDNASAEHNDQILQQNSGYLVDGASGAGAGDRYYIPESANISDFTVSNYPSTKYRLYLNGNLIDPSRFSSENNTGEKLNNTENGLKSAKADSRFEKELDIPSCDTSNSEVKVIDENSDWEDINDEDFRIFCVKPGDYSEKGDRWFKVTQSGSESKRRYILYDGPSDEHPVDQSESEKAILPTLMFKWSSYWTVQGVTIYSDRDYDPVYVRKGAEHNIFDRILVSGGPDKEISRSTLIDIVGDDTTVQNSVARNAKEGHGDRNCASSSTRKDYRGIVRNIRLVSNQFYDCTDGIQLVRSQRTTEPRYPGAIIAHNDFYISDHPKWRTDQDEVCAENAVDIKGGGTKWSNRVKVIGNRMWGYTHYGCGSDGREQSKSALSPFVVHNEEEEDDEERTPNVEMRNNVIFESAGGLTADDVKNVEFKNNLLHTFQEDQDEHSYVLKLVRQSRNFTISGNTISDTGYWVTTIFESPQGDFQDNVVIDGRKTKIRDGAEPNFEYGGNYYYGESERMGPEAGGGSIEDSNMKEFCVTLKAYTDPTEKCFPNAVSTSESPHGEDIGFRPPWK